MKIVIINKSDSLGGAAVVSRRLLDALRARGHEADMLVLHRPEPHAHVHRVVGRWRARLPFLLERLQIFLGNGRHRGNLFKADTASFGVPLHRDPLLAEADVVCLAWINQGMLSLPEIRRISEAGKPIVWIMHDMWCMTGLCHHAGECEGFKGECGLCPLLGRKASPRDLSHRVWRRKQALYRAIGKGGGITFVAVSDWLRERARASSLLRDARVQVIPNPVPDIPYRIDDKGRGRIVIMIVAARLDDSVKGLDIFKAMAARLKLNHPELAARLQFVAVGALKGPHALDDFPLELTATGPLGIHDLAQLYRRAHIVLSTSRYETLPGTLIEGQAHGALPVAFDRGGQSDIITDGVTGILAPFGADPAADMEAALLRGVEMVENTGYRELQQRLTASVRERFDAGAVADRFVKLFEELKGK